MIIASRFLAGLKCFSAISSRRKDGGKHRAVFSSSDCQNNCWLDACLYLAAPVSLWMTNVEFALKGTLTCIHPTIHCMQALRRKATSPPPPPPQGKMSNFGPKFLPFLETWHDCSFKYSKNLLLGEKDILARIFYKSHLFRSSSAKCTFL